LLNENILTFFIVEKLIREIPDLRDHAIENMIKRLQMAFGYYNEAIYLLRYYRDECKQRILTKTNPFLAVGILQQNNIQIPSGHLTKSSVEPSELVKNAIRKRQESNILKYEYITNLFIQLIFPQVLMLQQDQGLIERLKQIQIPIKM